MARDDGPRLVVFCAVVDFAVEDLAIEDFAVEALAAVDLAGSGVDGAGASAGLAEEGSGPLASSFSKSDRFFLGHDWLQSCCTSWATR